MSRPFLSIIIPAYNEAERLPFTLIDLDRQLRQTDYQYEILVIDDGSDDKTSEIVEKFKTILPDLKLINNTGNRGQGSAIKIGMLSARGNWRLAMDADNAIPISQFIKVVPELADSTGAPGYDIWVASRGLKETVLNPAPPISRHLLERGLNYLTRVVFKSKLRDFYLGFHCFSAESAEKIFNLLKMDNWSFAPESLILAERLNFKIKEFPVLGSHRGGRALRVKNYLQIFWNIFKIQWAVKRGRYQ